jgi:hypothetical protein
MRCYCPELASRFAKNINCSKYTYGNLPAGTLIGEEGLENKNPDEIISRCIEAVKAFVS